MRIKILLLAALLLASCSPLKRMSHSQRTDSTSVDKTEIRKIVTDIVREQGSLLQTIVEFYPSVIDTQTPTPSGPEAVAPIIQPAVKRIVRTELNTHREQATVTDSTAKNDTATEVKATVSDKVIEKPPAGVAAIKWIAIGLGALLLIIIAIKFLR